MLQIAVVPTLNSIIAPALRVALVAGTHSSGRASDSKSLSMLDFIEACRDIGQRPIFDYIVAAI